MGMSGPEARGDSSPPVSWLPAGSVQVDQAVISQEGDESLSIPEQYMQTILDLAQSTIPSTGVSLCGTALNTQSCTSPCDLPVVPWDAPMIEISTNPGVKVAIDHNAAPLSPELEYLMRQLSVYTLIPLNVVVVCRLARHIDSTQGSLSTRSRCSYPDSLICHISQLRILNNWLMM